MTAAALMMGANSPDGWAQTLIFASMPRAPRTVSMKTAFLLF